MIVTKTDRNYFVNGDKTRWPSVTQVLGVINKPALNYWIQNESIKLIEEYLKTLKHTRIFVTEAAIAEIVKKAKERPDKLKQEAGDIGTKTHQAIEAFIKTGITQVDKEIEAPFNSFLMYWESHKIKVLGTEISVCSKEHGYVGTIDLLAEDDTGVFIGDYKTSKSGVYAENALQLGGYAQALSETKGIPLNTIGGKIFWLNKLEPEFKPYIVPDMPKTIHGYLGALTLFNSLKLDLLKEEQGGKLVW